MPIELSDNRIPSAPVLRHQVIGEYACLAIVRYEQRDRLKKNQVTNQMERIQKGIRQDGSPKYAQELVIHGVAMEGCTMQSKLGDTCTTPAPGDRVRVIIKGLSFGHWIEALKAHKTAHGKLAVGDLLYLETTHAQQYDENGNPKGPEIRDQAQAAAVPRSVTLGFYGSLQLAPSQSPEWQEHCERLYHEDQVAMQRRDAQELPDEFGDDGYEAVAPAVQRPPAPPARPMAPPPAPAGARPAMPPRPPMAPPAPVRPPF